MELPYGTNDLRETRVISGCAVTCHVRDCRIVVPRQRRFFQTSDEFLCKIHGIYLSPTTFEYQDRRRNLLWREAEDCELLAAIAKVKRTMARLGRECDEDALTWNVFRAFEREQRLGRLAQILLAGGADPPPREPEIIYWACKDGGLWPRLSEAREEFGEPRLRGSEPDVALWWPGKCLVFVEAKFCAGNATRPGAMHGCVDHRPEAYGQHSHFHKVFRADYEEIAVKNRKYELMRNWLLGSWIAQAQGAAFHLVNLVRWNAEQDIEMEFGDRFCRQCADRLFLRATWESIWDALPLCGLSDETIRILDAYFRTKSAGYDHQGRLSNAFTAQRDL